MIDASKLISTIAIAIAIVSGVLGLVTYKLIDGISRTPENANKIFTPALIFAGLIEMSALSLIGMAFLLLVKG